MKTQSACALVVMFCSVHAISFADPPAAAAARDQDLDAQVAMILDHPLPESDYTQADRCLSAGIYEHVEVLDTRRLLFRGNRGSLWLNQLRYNCAGLRDDSVLIFEMRDHRVCELDGLRSVPGNGSFAGDFGVHCTLGDFEPITQAQADQLRKALERGAHVPMLPKAAQDE